VLATQDGIDALGSDYEPLPTGEELQKYWLQRLPDGERAVLELLINEAGGDLPARDHRREHRIQAVESRRLHSAADGERSLWRTLAAAK
jgi:hypothetical protein